MSTIWRFDYLENKHTLYRGKDCMKEIRNSLKEHAKMKNMILLIKKELKSHEDAKDYYICGKEIQKMLKI